MECKWIAVLIAFCCVCSCIAVSTPDTAASPSPIVDTSLLYTHLSTGIPQDAYPSPIQRIIQYFRGDDPALNNLEALFPDIMRPIFGPAQEILDLKNVEKEQCFQKFNGYKDLKDEKNNLVMFYRYLLQEHAHLLSKVSVKTQLELVEKLLSSEQENLELVFSICSEPAPPTESLMSGLVWRVIIDVLVAYVIFQAIQIYKYWRSEVQRKADYDNFKKDPRVQSISARRILDKLYEEGAVTGNEEIVTIEEIANIDQEILRSRQARENLLLELADQPQDIS
jgi:hypothetical protein